ncbi:MAG: flippase-like domain-containing protein [Candidatus Obscuribacterales bacterium]|nr:flippase-like domain-containing protein [Candidatus Obscuribacterales bacterium]
MPQGTTAIKPTRTADDIQSSQPQGGHVPPIPILGVISNLSPAAKTRIKLGVSIVLFASLFLFGKIDLSKSWAAALSANKWYLFSAFVLFLLVPFQNAHRWQLLASAVGLRKPLLKMVQYCYVGLFFNLFLPSTVGGDFSRCYYLSKGTGKYMHAASSVLVDRAMGLAVLLLFATVGILLGPGGSGLPWQLKMPIFGATLGIYLIMPFLPQLSNKILGESNWFSRKLNQSSASVYWQDKGLIFMTLVLSVALQTVIVVCHMAVGLALGLNEVPFWYYFVFYPSVAVLGFVTPSINGIGVREWAYTYFLTLAGVDAARALTYAIIWFGLITMSSLVGGLVYMIGHFKPPSESSEAVALETAY